MVLQPRLCHMMAAGMFTSRTCSHVRTVRLAYMLTFAYSSTLVCCLHRRPRASFDERERPPPCNVIGCFGLNPHTPEEMVREKFEKFGKISKVVLVKDRQTGLSRGFGFITYEDVADATDAVEKMNHTQLDDRNVCGLTCTLPLFLC